MSPFIDTVNTILSIGTILLQFFIVILIVMATTKDEGPVSRWLGEKSLLLITLIGLISMFSSLLYSEVIKYPPCTLCWYQRIFMYGIGILGITALTKKFEKEIFVFIKTFSIIGAIIALYHVMIRIIGTEPIPCSANGPSCLQELFLQFGYIDIPMMSFTGFLLILVLIWNRKRISTIS